MTNRRLRLLHLLSGGTVGGCEQHVLSLLSHLDTGRYEPWVAVFEAEPDDAAPMVPAFRAAGVRVIDLRATRRADAAAILRLGRLMRRVRFDVVHAHSFRTELAAVTWAKGAHLAPFVVRTVHNTDDYYTRQPYSTLARASARLLDRVIVISDSVGSFLRDAISLPSTKMRRVYYGLDSDAWETRTNGEISARHAPTIAVIARLAPQKGHRVLIDALPTVASQVPDVRVRLVGHEELSTIAELRAHAEIRGVAGRVEFEGFRSDVAAVLCDADLFALPSLWEGFGLVLLEAMAMGCPVVASRVGAVPEVVVDGETGILVPPGEPGPLANALLRVLKDPSLAGRLGAAGRARVRSSFTVDQMVAQTDELYQEIVA